MSMMNSLIAAAPPGSENCWNYLLIALSFFVTGILASLLVNRSTWHNTTSLYKHLEATSLKGIVGAFLASPFAIILANLPFMPDWAYIESAPRLPTWIPLLTAELIGGILAVLLTE